MCNDITVIIDVIYRNDMATTRATTPPPATTTQHHRLQFRVLNQRAVANGVIFKCLLAGTKDLARCVPPKSLLQAKASCQSVHQQFCLCVLVVSALKTSSCSLYDLQCSESCNRQYIPSQSTISCFFSLNGNKMNATLKVKKKCSFLFICNFFFLYYVLIQ